MSAKFAIAQQFIDAYPNDAARVLEVLDHSAVSAFFDALSDSQSSSLLAAMLPFHAAKCISHLSTDVAARYIAQLEPATGANILRHLQEGTKEDILRRLPKQLSVRIVARLNYTLSVVGAWLEAHVLTLPSDCSIGEAKLRLKNEGYSDFQRLYVVDEDKNLIGSVKLVSLIQTDDNSHLKDHFERQVQSIRANTSIDVAIDDSKWLDNEYLPVVDRKNRFLGILQHAALRVAVSSQRTSTKALDASGIYMDLAEYCYLGLAGVLSSSLASEHRSTENERG